MALVLRLCFLVASFSFRYVNSFAVDGVATTFNHTSKEQPARLEFSAISQSGPAFDLFILALQQFQQANQSHELSYYQIAGTLLDLKTVMQCSRSSHRQESMGGHFYPGMAYRAATL